ncbi:sodium-dependent transporter [Thiohalophilus thiocyanatoxydans]|uniref:Transporter n=1 Tax=Thiohalophilus thiocyanatoxydans TaxID=381308 RepID=A0A4R8IPL7_9GAMM|nr:sodium-dependent transporter [Thiohalophilus thiocyanatoxydans]TDY02458.1 NSS family neurotransmitter:Na+ symporter [Thiohalophilus thiocyanatoxydans]
MARTSMHGQWSSRWAFILAATGSAVGLGNIWKFPYITGENGGGAFVLVYLACIVLIGVPVMMAEIMLGRRGRKSPINTMYDLAIESGHNPNWKWLGWLGVLAGFLILSYYSVVAGWSLAYVFRSASGTFTGATADGVESLFLDGFLSHPETLLFWHTLFMVMTMLIVARGVKSGLESAVKLLMPALFLLLLLMVGYAMSQGEAFMQGLNFMFRPNFSALSWGGVLTAMGQAFFTLSLGMGAIMVYGSYLSSSASITRTTFMIAIADTGVALLAGVAIFPIIFANQMEPGAGPGLIFISLPLAFGHMPAGVLFGTLFFVLLSFAAWTSSISLLEPVVTWLVETFHWRRVTATLYAGILTWLLGVVSVFSFSDWAFEFEFAGQLKENGVFDILDILTTNIMLPLGGLFIALFAAWFMSREASRDELGLGDGVRYNLWRVLVKFVTPAAILLVFLNLIGVI